MFTELEITPAWIVATVGFALAAGVTTLVWGRRLPRRADWLVGVGLVALLTLSILTWSSNGDGATFRVKTWLTGWIWPREESGALTVGILQDALGVAFSGLSALVAALMVLHGALLGRDERPERISAAAIISVSGVTLAWLSLTPWLSFVGLSITLLGGFLALGSRWGLDDEAAIAARFGRERAWGLLFSVLGACSLASSGVPLGFVQVVGTTSVSTGAFLGAGFLALGLFIQFQPFPLLGWLVMESDTLPISRVVFGQVFPGWASLAVLTRFEPQLRSIGIFPAFGWIALASAVLTSLTGLMQPSWRTGLSAWVSAGFAAATAALAFAGPWAGLAIALGIGLAGIVATMLASSTEPDGKPPVRPSDRGHPAWTKIGSFSAAAAGSGLIGFVSAGGNIRWLAGGLAIDVSVAAAFAVVIFLLTVLIWKEAWMMSRLRIAGETHWTVMIPPYLMLALSLGLVWTGTVTGGALPGDPDRVGGSMLDAFFGASASDEAGFLNASWFYWGAVLLGVITAWWTAARQQDQWRNLHRAFPRTSEFFAGGYGVDALTRRTADVVTGGGGWITELTDRRAWGSWLPWFLAGVTTSVSRIVSSGDTLLTNRLDRSVRRTMEVPAKLLQLVQSGDVQWYLFFAVGSGIAILIHFLRI